MTKTSLKPRRVLIADDDERVLSLLVELLEQEGYEVFAAQDGGTALELALATDLDVVVSDVVMPVLDGIELCRRLKKHVDTARVPVLLISGLRRSSDDGLEGLNAGADDYLDVPFRNEAFLVKVARLAERHQIEKHYREIVEQAADIIYTRTIDGHITSINAAGCEFFGRSANELVGAHLSELIGAEAIFGHVVLAVGTMLGKMPSADDAMAIATDAAANKIHSLSPAPSVFTRFHSPLPCIFTHPSNDSSCKSFFLQRSYWPLPKILGANFFTT